MVGTRHEGSVLGACAGARWAAQDAEAVQGRQEEMTAAEKRYVNAVAMLGCILCRELHRPGSPAEVHHIRTGQGAQQRASNWLIVPLCPVCHRGQHGIHGDRQLLRQAKVTEIDLLGMTIQSMQEGA